MMKKNNKINPHIDNRKIFASMFFVIALFFAASYFVFFAQIPSQAKVHIQIQDQSQFQDIARQLEAPRSSQEEEKELMDTLRISNQKK